MIGFDLHFSTKVCGVYAFTHVATGRQYIGSTINMYKRVSKHLSELKKGRHHSPILQNGWTKHGDEAFAFSILEKVLDQALLIEREQYWLDTVNPHYNICKMAQSVLGIKRSDETKRKMSEAMKGVPKSEEHRKTLSETKKANPIPITESNRQALNASLAGVKKAPRSAEHQEKIASSNRGKTRSLEAREKSRESMTGFKHTKESRDRMANSARNRSEEHRQRIGAARAKTYIAVSPEGVEFEVTNMREFCRNNPELRQASMCAVAGGRQTHHKGWLCSHLQNP